MRGAYTQFIKSKGSGFESRLTPAVEKAMAIRKEEAERRLARIMNGKEPFHKNGGV
jgi:hypothetical protein